VVQGRSLDGCWAKVPDAAYPRLAPPRAVAEASRPRLVQPWVASEQPPVALRWPLLAPVLFEATDLQSATQVTRTLSPG